MTRCYGWSLPCTSLIPIADCLNHHYNSVGHCMIDKEREILGKEDEIYNMKKLKCNLDIIGIEGNKKLYNWKLDYIEK